MIPKVAVKAKVIGRGEIDKKLTFVDIMATNPSKQRLKRLVASLKTPKAKKAKKTDAKKGKKA